MWVFGVCLVKWSKLVFSVQKTDKVQPKSHSLCWIRNVFLCRERKTARLGGKTTQAFLWTVCVCVENTPVYAHQSVGVSLWDFVAFLCWFKWCSVERLVSVFNKGNTKAIPAPCKTYSHLWTFSTVAHKCEVGGKQFRVFFCVCKHQLPSLAQFSIAI